VKYLGWFDGNPATLYPLPPEDGAKKYLEFMACSTTSISGSTSSSPDYPDRLDAALPIIRYGPMKH
jgi:alkyl sulfatase BDS1-like metallo-beta-lactamase superfamily hydrolase